MVGIKKYYIGSSTNNKRKKYLSIVCSQGYGKGVKRIIGLGYLDDFQKINPDSHMILKEKLKEINYEINELNKEQVKESLLNSIKSVNVEERLINHGVKSIYNVIDELQIFQSLPKSKHKQLEQLLKYTISSRIINPTSIIQTFNQKDDFKTDITLKKSSFYNLLDILSDSYQNIYKTMNKVISQKTNRDAELVYFDSSTAYFETFVRDGLRFPGYSKDGKFKEDQVVIGMATDPNGIPVHAEIFKGNTADSSTFIPFVLKMKSIYDIKKITIVADKGMSINKNIRFLEQNGLDFVISYRVKSATKEFKKYVLSESGWIGDENFKYKEQEIASFWKNKRNNGHIRKKIITYSSSRASKDRKDRQQLIQNFTKKQNKNGLVKIEDLMGMKKYKFYERIGKTEFKLNISKIKEDELYDGIYVYETSRTELKPSEVVEIYHKQWQIEENFRTLKSSLNVRPMHVWTEKHIRGHFVLCFIALVVLKYCIYKINKFFEDNGIVDKITNDKLIKIINGAFTHQKIINNEVKSETFISKNSDKMNDYWVLNEILR
ncbi:IS1634 family transposase [Mycoplasmopsis ciconiae]|uniref:IS1634 family transposase n=1 Tax=Mycoplasmopsis ciconiae TaxID=561067 RepID=A0ABU7MM73_9BACT|nr:IS1634 family transposase [Mycoplasmopsis ciconiae]